MKSQNRIVVISFILAAGFWVVDSFNDAMYFDHEPFLYELFHPSSFELYIRLLGMVFIVATGIIISRFYNSRLAAEEKYRTLVETADDVILLTDLNGKHLFRNAAYWTSRGYKPGENIPSDDFANIHPDDIPVIKEHMAALIEKGSGTSEYRVKHKDGACLHQFAKSRVIYDNHGKPKSILIIIRDISESKKLQEQLIAQDRLASIGQLVAGVSHEINNPLTSIIGFSDMLIKRELPGDVIDDLKIINTAARRTALIVKNLLTFARNRPEEKMSVDINANVLSVQSLRVHEQKVANIQVNLNLAPDLPQIIGNSHQLQQVLLNIIINAEQAMSEANNKGTLTITTESLGDIIRTSVTDDGPGISPENMKKLFTPFFSTKQVGKGTGLGLSICHGIMTAHGGRIFAQSELGKGTTFVMELPAP